MTNNDPGEGQPLSADNYLAVYGGSSLLDLFYPIGSTYKTYNTNFDPNVAWGGVWTEDISSENMIITKIERAEVQTVSAGTFAVTTNAGTNLTIQYTNYGASMAVRYGGENINFVRFSHIIRMSPSTTADWGIFNVASGSVNWCYYAGGLNGNYRNTRNEGIAPEGQSSAGFYYANMIATEGGNKTVTSITGVASRSPKVDTNIWMLSGSIISSSSASAVKFNTQATSEAQGAIPGIYQRGANASNLTYVHNILEIYESSTNKNYKIWKRTA